VIGVDIIDIDRFAQAAQRTPRLLERIFTPAEIAYCSNKKNPYPSYAVRFAAKEAVRKLDQLMIQGVSFHDIEVVTNEDGKPSIALHGRAEQNGKIIGLENIHVSLSHSRNLAIAVTYVEGG
jgi:holo-[acyl-carrier protein] synthase